MDYVPLVNEQIEDGKRLLERLAEEGVTVKAAGPVSVTAWPVNVNAPTAAPTR